MRDVKTWIIIGLLLLVAGLILFQPQPQPNHEKIAALENENAILKVREFQLMEDKVKLFAKLAQDSADQSKERTTYQREAKKQSATIANLRANPKVVTIIAESPEIDSLIHEYEAQDSLKDARITRLESDLKELRVDVAGIQQNFEALLETERQQTAIQEQLAQDYKNQARKLRRAGRLIKVGAIIGIVGALFVR